MAITAPSIKRYSLPTDTSEKDLRMTRTKISVPPVVPPRLKTAEIPIPITAPPKTAEISGSDVGGGNTLNMFRTIFEAILASKVFWASKNSARNMDQRKVLSLPNAFYLATKGGGVLWKSGSFEPGYCFDAVILDDSRFCDGVQRTPYERIERLITRSDDRDICAKYIDGVCVYKKGE